MIAMLQFTALFMMLMNSLTVAQGLLKDIFASIGPLAKLFASSVKPGFKAALAVMMYWLVVYKFVKAQIMDVKAVRAHHLSIKHVCHTNLLTSSCVSNFDGAA